MATEGHGHRSKYGAAGKKSDIVRIMQLRGKGMKYREIAEAMGTTEQVIKNTVYRAGLMSQNGKTPSYKKEREKSRMKQINELEGLVAQYENGRIEKQFYKDDNRGRAAAVTTHIAQCIAIGNTVDIENIDTLYAAFEAYIRLCAETDSPITMITACLALGTPKAMLYRWRTGMTRQRDPAYKEFADSVFYAVQAGIETCMATGLINPVVGIWWEKAHFHEVEAEKTGAVELGEEQGRKTAQQIAEEYEGVVLPE